MATMDAYVLEAFDAPPRFARVARPEAREGEVLLRVEATSVNPADDLVARGFFRGRLEYRFPAVFGRDVAGVVEVVGDGVERLAAGDAVFGFVKRDYIGDGCFAGHVAVPEDRFVALRPPGLDLDAAGALGLASVTALQCLDALALEPGATLLINGATGGVGSFATQIARACGIRVLATARPGVEDEHARSLGADLTLDWSTGRVADLAREACPDGVDGVLDLVSDRDGLPLLAGRALREGGHGVTTRMDDPPQPDGRTIEMVHSAADLGSLARIAALVESGQVRVPVTERFPFAELPAAFARLREGVCGKIAVRVAA